MDKLDKYHQECDKSKIYGVDEYYDYTLCHYQTLPMIYKAMKELQEENAKLKAKFDDFHKFLVLNDKIPPPPPPEPIKVGQTVMIQPVPTQSVEQSKTSPVQPKPPTIAPKPVLTREKKLINLNF